MPTVGQILALAGTNALMGVEGILVEADNVQRFYVLIKDIQPEGEPFQNVRGQQRAYVEITAKASDVNKPREVSTMFELPDGRTFNTLRLLESEDMDHVTWVCEAQRK